MKKMGKRVSIIILLICILICGVTLPSAAAEEVEAALKLESKAAILMEASSGKVLYAMNENEALPPASVTKIMTLLLVMEAIDEDKISLDDIVCASERACSMGGSQIYLEVGERMSVEDLLKSVIISSANDAAVALAEHVCGTEEAFVEQMNKKAETLGMKNTHFENTNGLDDTTKKHLTSALDIAIMSRELIRYPKITEYSGIWMDTIRDGEFGLTNTNRLIRYYKGATGLKTGSTAKAGFCISATAERDGMTLISVIMGAQTRDKRNAEATALLNFGFSEFGLYRDEGERLADIAVVNGKANKCKLIAKEFTCVLPKRSIKDVERSVNLPQSVNAPIKAGEVIGEIRYILNGETIGISQISVESAVERLGFLDYLIRAIAAIALK